MLAEMTRSEHSHMQMRSSVGSFQLKTLGAGATALTGLADLVELDALPSDATAAELRDWAQQLLQALGTSNAEAPLAPAGESSPVSPWTTTSGMPSTAKPTTNEAKRTHPVSMDTRKSTVWKSANRFMRSTT